MTSDLNSPVPSPLAPDLPRLLAEAVEAAANGILITDRKGSILWSNAAFTRMTGYTREEIVGKNPRFLKSGAQSEEFYAELWQTIRSGKIWQGTLFNRRKDGSEYCEEMTITPILDAQGAIGHFIAIKQDVSEKRQFEEHQARLVAVLEATPDFVGISDPQRRVLFLNRAGREMIGRAEMDDLSNTHLDIYHPDWARKVIVNEGIPAAIRTGTWMGETALLNRAGREIPVSQVIIADKTATGELRFLATIMRDLTDRKKLEGQLQQAQKLEAIGQLAGGVAHDFNNLLTVISGYSEIMIGRLPHDDPARPLLQEIHKAGERAAGLTRQLLAFSRKQVLEPRVLDLNSVVTDTEKMLRRLIGEDVILWTNLAPGLARVKVDPGQIEQVIMNLAVNARDAMPQGGKLTIETANVELDGSMGHGHPEAKPGCYVMLSVSDNGSGMTPEIQARIFEPFFTTKGPTKGTGLGLATVYGIIKQSDGYIYVYSEPGRGTAFKIYLPVIEASAAVAQPRPGVKAARTGAETILLVEDEDAVRAVTRYVLQSLGYKVLEASLWKEAVRISEEHQSPIHLLLTDVVMPEMGGRELAERLTKQRPDLKVLYLSGYTDDAVIRHGILQADVAFLQKPFAPAALAAKVREVLDL